MGKKYLFTEEFIKHKKVVLELYLIILTLIKLTLIILNLWECYRKNYLYFLKE